MSAIVNLSVLNAKELFGTLSVLLPSKTEATPIGLRLSNHQLKLTMNSGFVAVYDTWVESEDEWETTFLYQDINPLLTYAGDTVIECNQFGITVESDNCSTVFPVAYSTIGNQSFDEYSFHKMPEQSESNIRLLLKLGLERIYKTAYPVYARGGIAIVKYPSFYAQVRLTEPFDGISLSLTHWSIIERFRPTEYSQDNSQCLVLKNNVWTIMLPCTTSAQENNFMSLLEGMSSTLTMNLKEYSESVRIMARAKGVDYCDITVYKGGLVTTASSSNITTSITYGDIGGEVVNVFTLPVSIWLAMLSAVGDTTAELLLGGGKLCLRNSIIAMLLRVAP